MPSQDKLIKQGILLTDTTFDEIIKRLQNGVKTSDTLESFLTKHKEVIVDNPLVAIGYKDKLTEIILQETNNHKFSRPAQKELTRLTIENRVGDLITNVGDDIKQDVRDIVSDGYNNNLSQDEIARNISDSISKIKNTRARVIARTEIARTATASDYVINRERGATHFKVDCRESCCPVCAERYNWGKEEFSIDDVGMLPPLHPNCRCYAMFFIKDDDEADVLTRKPPTQQKTTKTTTTETKPATENPRISELEKEIADVQAITDKWRKRGNTNLAETFEGDVRRLKEELETLKNPTTTQTQQKTEDTTQNDMINNILSDVLKDVGLEDIAPEKKSINPNVKIEKNIETTHESNLWENLAEKHGLELVEASKTKVTFYDKEYETPIRFNIPKNKDWIDYTNRGLKKRNMEDVLEFYNSATPLQKKAVPIMEIQGKNLDQGRVTIGVDEFKLELFETAFYHKEGGVNDGNLKGAMHHEMWHCVDVRMTPEDEARTLLLLKSSKPRSDYKKVVTKDRRAKKKTGGQTFVSTYARQSGDNKIYEDFAESGSVMSSDTYLVQDALKGRGYVKISKKEFKKLNPNRAKYFEDLMKNGELLW